MNQPAQPVFLLDCPLNNEAAVLHAAQRLWLLLQALDLPAHRAAMIAAHAGRFALFAVGNPHQPPGRLQLRQPQPGAFELHITGLPDDPDLGHRLDRLRRDGQPELCEVDAAAGAPDARALSVRCSLRLAAKPPPETPLDVARAMDAWQQLADEARAATARQRQLVEELEETNRGVLALHAELDAHTAMLRQLNETLEQRVADRTRQLERRNRQLRSVASQLNQAEQRERQRIAEVLHDHLQQLLVAAKMHLNLSQTQTGPPSAGLDEVANLIDESIDVSRNLTLRLSPPVLHSAGLAAGLQWLARRMREQHGVDVTLQTLGDEPPLDDDLRSLVFRCAQELLFNIVKHAQVSHARVELDFEQPERIRLCVEDRGRGFEPDQAEEPAAEGGFGLLSIRERLEWFGGRIHIHSQPGLTRITLTVPIQAE